MSVPQAALPVSARTTVLAMGLAVVALAAFAIYLNGLYYRSYGPFYDSLSYMNFMAELMVRARSEGVLSAVRLGSVNSTVFLPWVESALLGPLLQPARADAVLLQLPLVGAQVAAAYLFFRRVACYERPMAAAFAMLTVTYAAVFFFNGGLSDLRMDLAQALALGTAGAVLAVARATGARRHWFLLGVALAAALLFRATSAVYVVLLLVIAGVTDLVVARVDRRRRLLDYLAAGVTAAVLAGWFYVLNFQLLYEYYTARNYDALARLPLPQSIGHLRLVFATHMGLPVAVLAGAVFLGAVCQRVASRQPLARGLNWAMLLTGLLPVGFLIALGTSLGNPYVSMTSVPGLLMFALAPYAGRPGSAANVHLVGAAVLATCAVVVITAWGGVRTHTTNADPWRPLAPALQNITGAIDADLAARGKREASFEVTYVGTLDSTVVFNSLIFDRGFVPLNGSNAIKGRVHLKTADLGVSFANPYDWKALPGASDQDKVAGLVSDAVRNVDYLIFPEDGNTLIEHHPINPYAIAYRDQILARGGFTRIAGPVRVSGMERVSVYRNDNRK
ncbi:MAG: hypothetical protein JWP60_3744 [Ramlibacter sp.]|nr:hypothetical protein [Ramlibacter sp.]